MKLIMSVSYSHILISLVLCSANTSLKEMRPAKGLSALLVPWLTTENQKTPTLGWLWKGVGRSILGLTARQEQDGSSLHVLMLGLVLGSACSQIPE